MGTAHTCKAQLTRLDSTAAQLAQRRLTAFGELKIVGDTSFAGLFSLLGSDRTAPTTFDLQQFAATITKGDTAEVMSILISGDVFGPQDQISKPVSFTVSKPIDLSNGDKLILETNRDRYVHYTEAPARTFWDRIVEPAVVIASAGLIVALFFLIRS